MTREDFLTHREPLQRFLGLVHQFTAMIVLATFAAYGVAGYLWWQGAGLPALLIATLAYLFFRAFRPVSLHLARWRLAGLPPRAGKRRPQVVRLQAVRAPEPAAREAVPPAMQIWTRSFGKRWPYTQSAQARAIHSCVSPATPSWWEPSASTPKVGSSMPRGSSRRTLGGNLSPTIAGPATPARACRTAAMSRPSDGEADASRSSRVPSPVGRGIRRLDAHTTSETPPTRYRGRLANVVSGNSWQ